MTSLYKYSEIGLIKRVPKTQQNPVGAISEKSIPCDQTSLVLIGGSGTNIEKFANHYASTFEKIFTENYITGVDIFSFYYNFWDREPWMDRINLMRRAGRRVRLNAQDESKMKIMLEHEPEPMFIRKMFNILIRPRVATRGGKRIDAVAAVQNMRKLRLFLHCYGSTIIKYLEQLTIKKMLSYGYSKNEIDIILKELFVIAHAPAVLLGKSAFNFISFGSADDNSINHHNHFYKYIRDNAYKLKPSFFPEPLGNIFITGHAKRTDDTCIIHGTYGLTYESEFILTNDGKVIYAAERNAIINSIRASLQNYPLSPIPVLVSDRNADFYELSRNGQEFYKQMITDLRTRRQNQARGCQR